MLCWRQCVSYRWKLLGSETKIKQQKKYTRLIIGQKYKDEYKISHVDHGKFRIYSVFGPQGDWVRVKKCHQLIFWPF